MNKLIEFVYAKRCDVIEKIMSWVQMILCLVIIVSLIVLLCINGALNHNYIRIVCISWFISVLINGINEIVKSKTIELGYDIKPDFEAMLEKLISNVNDEFRCEAKHITNTALEYMEIFQKSILKTKSTELFGFGLAEVVLSVAILVTQIFN